MRERNLDPHIRYSCIQCGACCRQPWRVVLEPEKLPAGIPLVEDGPHYLDPDVSSILPIAFEVVDPKGDLAAYTTSLYQTFQTAQVTELLTRYGPIAEVWIDIPGVMGRGYRTFLYKYIAGLQPGTVIMMNSGISTGETYNVDYAWPSDLIAIERRLPPESGHKKWRTIEGEEYYIPGEVCDPIGKDWFYLEGDVPRADQELVEQFETCRARGVNFLLDVPPDKHGVIPEASVRALQRLRKNARI